MINVWINGFGRIGRDILKISENMQWVKVVAINSRGTADIYAKLLKYDSTYWIRNWDVRSENGNFIVNNRQIKLLNNDNPYNINWKESNVDVVVECTWKFLDRKYLQWHIDNGAKKVVLTAPSKEVDIMIIMWVNENEYNPLKHNIISNSSCTANCLWPIVKLIEKYYGIEYGMMTTVHTYTSNQNILDNSHSEDYRRWRTPYNSIIPTSTWATQSIERIMPQLKWKLSWISLRVPVQVVSIIDLVVTLKKNTNVNEINSMFEKNKSDIIDIVYEQLVWIDYKWSKYSAIIDASLTQVIWGNMLKVCAWYDNEWAYSQRVIDLAIKLFNF